MPFFQGILTIFKDYCLNCTVSGLSYLVDSRYHHTERWFWLLCLGFSSFGVYHFIEDTIDEFETGSINMVVESLQPQENTIFPTIAVCEMGYTKDDYDFLNDLAEEVTDGSEDDENFGDVYDFLMRIVYFNLYAINTYQSYCKKYEGKPGLSPCPQDDYLNITQRTIASCPELFEECLWMGRPFNCCTYFVPLNTTYGTCYMLNSIQATTKDGPNWMDVTMNRQTGPGEIQLVLHRSARVCLMNEEDVPNFLLSNLHLELRNKDTNLFVGFKLMSMFNDPGLFNVEPEKRQCMFKEEPSGSKFKYYSFSACVTECMKQAQLDHCGCAFHHMNFNEFDQTPICNYTGLKCLDTGEHIFPRSSILQAWNEQGQKNCECYPSCSDHEIKILAEVHGKFKKRKITIKLIELPTQRYRRQRVKDFTDLVVAVGGILSLFLGASILSLVELVYYFSVRLIGTSWMNRRSRNQFNTL